MATYYTSSSASGGGDGSLGDEFTLAEALSSVNVSDDDLVIIKADGIYAPTAAITKDTNEVAYIGGNSSGTVDGTRPVLSGASVADNSKIIALGGENTHWAFIDFDGSDDVDFCVRSDGTSDDQSFTDCIFRDATSDCFDCNSDRFVFFRCEFYGAGSHGVDSPGQHTKYVECWFHDITSSGIDRGARAMIVNCAFRDCGTGADLEDPDCFVSGCVFHDNTTGLVAGDTIPIVNCVFTNNTTGISVGSGVVCFAINCGFGSGALANTTKQSGAGTYIEILPQTGDPGYTSVTDGSEDFTPGSSGAFLGDGVPYPYLYHATNASDIGPIQRHAASGGGWGFRRRPRVTGG